jgi:hypothetical protein
MAFHYSTQTSLLLSFMQNLVSLPPRQAADPDRDANLDIDAAAVKELVRAVQRADY